MSRTRKNNSRSEFLAERVRIAQESGQAFAKISIGTGEGNARSEIERDRFSHDPMATTSSIYEDNPRR